MANLATLKAALNAAIYQNNQNAISGEALNTILNSIIDTLGAGYRYAGVATPSANPGTIDNRVFYLATAAGTYTNFGAVQLDGKSLHIFIYDTTWHNIALDVPTTAAIPVIAGSGENAVKGKYPSITASGDGAHAIGFSNEENGFTLSATGEGAHAEGDAYGGNITASVDGAHAEGCAEDGSITASGNGAHAEGHASAENISAIESGAHAEGYASDSPILASGYGAHAEGCTEGTGPIVASGNGSHAEGSGSTASGDSAHAEGSSTIAQNVAEHAEGKYNASHKKTTGTAAEQAAGTTLSSVGCGTSANDRKNAVEVMQNGDMYVKGVGGYDGTNPAHETTWPLNFLFDALIAISGASGSVIDYSGQLLVLDNDQFGVIMTAVTQDAVRINIFNNQFKNTIDAELGIDSQVGYVSYIGIDGASTIDNDNFSSGRCCCIYEYNDQRYYFAIEA